MKYSKIKKIESVDTEPVYHVTVEKNHNFFANEICVHNCDYRGEINIIVYNSDPIYPFEILDGDRIAQGVLNKIEQINWVSVAHLEDLTDTERGEGGFGHTGTK